MCSVTSNFTAVDKHTLYHLACSVENPKQGQPGCCLQVIHMASLHVLFASLAILAAARESHRPHLPSSQAGHHSTGPLEAFSALWHYNQVALDPFSAVCTARYALLLVWLLSERRQCDCNNNSILDPALPCVCVCVCVCVFCLSMATCTLVSGGALQHWCPNTVKYQMNSKTDGLA